jgi:regulator of protease activity HflC (stomatin/prohibitin superfamily)
MEALLGFVAFVAAGGLIMVGRSVKQVQQYEEGIVFRFGRVLPRTRPPGLTFVRPIGDKIQKVNKQIIAMTVPAQEGITRDNISGASKALVYFRRGSDQARRSTRTTCSPVPRRRPPFARITPDRASAAKRRATGQAAPPDHDED